MIRKLRIKLVAASMLSLILVLAVIIGASHILNYRGILSDADSVLALLQKRSSGTPADVDWHKAGSRFQSPELMFEIRFFSVLMDADGQVVSKDVRRIASVDDESVLQYALRAYQKGAACGFVDDFRYLRYEEDDATRIIFLDCGRTLAGFYAMLLNSMAVCLFGLCAVLLLILLLSGRIVKPISISYDKQKQFITDAGHEIKTPITIIDADAELLEMEYGQSEWIQDIRAQSKRLADLTNDLICLSRMEEAVEIPMIDFPISDLVSEAAGSFQALARTQNKAFSLSVQPMLSYHGNEKNLRQLVSILLDNAIKYSNDGGSIRVGLERQNRVLLLTVANTADGLSRETLRNMFDRFYRGDSSRCSQTKGYGIGLSIAKAIVAAHKGKIRAESKDGTELEITVSLPL